MEQNSSRSTTRSCRGLAMPLIDIRRRQLSVLIGGLMCSRLSRAQSRKVARVGALFLGISDADTFRREFREGLRELGYTEGRNIEYEFRSADGKLDRLHARAAD